MDLFFEIKQAALKSLKKGLGKHVTLTLEDVQLCRVKRYGDVTFPCFEIARQQKRSATEVATELAAHIAPHEWFTQVEARGGYVNFWLDDAHLYRALTSQIWRDKGIRAPRVQRSIRRLSVLSLPVSSRTTFHWHERRLLAVSSVLQSTSRFFGRRLFRVLELPVSKKTRSELSPKKIWRRFIRSWGVDDVDAIEDPEGYLVRVRQLTARFQTRRVLRVGSVSGPSTEKLFGALSKKELQTVQLAVQYLFLSVGSHHSLVLDSSYLTPVLNRLVALHRARVALHALRKRKPQRLQERHAWSAAQKVVLRRCLFATHDLRRAHRTNTVLPITRLWEDLLFLSRPITEELKHRKPEEVDRVLFGSIDLLVRKLASLLGLSQLDQLR